MKIGSFRIKYGGRVNYIGFVQIPNLLIRCQKNLKLTKTELILLLHLLSYQFDIDHICCPSLKEISKTTGISSRTIHAAKAGLIAKGFIKLKPKDARYRTNTYNSSGLIVKLDKLAKSIIEREYIFYPNKMPAEKYHKLMEDKTVEASLKFTEDV